VVLALAEPLVAAEVDDIEDVAFVPFVDVGEDVAFAIVAFAGIAVACERMLATSDSRPVPVAVSNTAEKDDTLSVAMIEASSDVSEGRFSPVGTPKPSIVVVVA